MNMPGLLLRAFELMLRASRRLLGRYTYLRLCEEIGRRALREIGVGESSDSTRNGEFSFLASLPPRACVIDVGACWGEFAEAALRLVPEASVHCFEPSPTSYAKLREIPGIRARNIALGDQAGEAELYADHDGSRKSSLYRRRLKHFGLRFELSRTVRVGTLDAYCEEEGINSIDLLKLDAEGHELAILRGASGLLSRRAIGRILFEFGGTDIDSRVFLQDFYYLLVPFGFALFRLLPGGQLYPLGGYREFHEQFTYCNYVAVRASQPKAAPA